VRDWRTLLAEPRFRALWLALLCDNLGNWCVIAALPILVAERFGTGMVLVLSLGLRILPKLVLAPLAGLVLRRFGPNRTAGCAMLAMALLTALLPWCADVVLLQVLLGAIGTLDIFILPGLLSLRGPVTPPGLEMACNTLFSVSDRAAKIAGPALGGLAVAAGLVPAFVGFALLIALSAIPVLRLTGQASAAVSPTARRTGSGLVGFLRLLRVDRQITGLMIAAVTYSVMLGGLRPFLFWANRDWFGASDTAWTGLLIAQGVGALIGAVVSAVFVPRLMRTISAYTLAMVAGIMEGSGHMLLLFVHTSAQAMTVLALAGIPEIISTAAWFTAIQARLSPDRQGSFYTFAAPLWDVAFAVGIASAGLHAEGVLSLSAYWAAISLTATLPLVPLILLHARDQRQMQRSG
jgi:hypothetical protein